MAKVAGSRTLWNGFIVVMLLAILSFSAVAQEVATPISDYYGSQFKFTKTWDGSPYNLVASQQSQTMSIFQLFWFAGNNLCDSATKSRIEAQLTQSEGKTVTCSATSGLGAYVGTCDWWCDIKTATGIDCQGDSNKCSILDKCVNNACVPVTCGSNQYVSDHTCHDKLPTQTCTDSDGGDLPYSKGSTYLNGNFAASDQCSVDGSMLQEKYCSGSIPNSKYYTCAYGCNGGTCLQQQITSCTGKVDGTIITSICEGDTAKKIVCRNQVEQTATQSCANIGKTCVAGECVTKSPTPTPTPSPTSGVCCRSIYNTYYAATSASTCNSRLLGNKDPTVEVNLCQGQIPIEVPFSGGVGEISQLNATVETKQPSVPIGRLDTASGATLLSALCTKDADCSSGNCADIETLEVGLKSSSRSILDRINEAKQDQASTISQISAGLSQGWLTKIILKVVGGAFFNVDAVTQTPKSICVIERENALITFWEDNQTAILIGGAVLVGLMFISKMGNK